MAVKTKPEVKPQTVENIYSLYLKKTFLVNRNYQRKLVWTIQEKERLIDSIVNGYPVPLFLLALSNYKNETVYEIIDGMQRLNAIVGFIEGEFHLGGKYFDLEATATTKLLRDNKTLIQKTPLLEREICAEFASYELPLSISPYQEREKIEDIFRRINANGRQLSSQELRQAGALGIFPIIVRELSEEIRGDISHNDRLLLQQMRTISINNSNLNYGINMRDIFWYKQEILTQINIRASRDEELIAHILVAIVYDYRSNTSAGELDKIYGTSDDAEISDIESQIDRFGGADFLKNQFNAVFQELKDLLSMSKKNFRQLIFKQNSKYLNHSFQVIFLVFHNLLVKQGLKISNHNALIDDLFGIGDLQITPSLEDLRKSKYRQKCIDAISGIISKHFIKRDEKDPVLSSGVAKLEALLSRSSTENNNYDFKQGLHEMEDSKFGNIIYDKVVETLTAMVNIGKGAVGYVIIGVADKKQIADRHQQFYNSNPLQFSTPSIPNSTFYVTGLQSEADKGVSKGVYKNIEDYRTKLEQFISAADISPSYYKTQILTNIDAFLYKGKYVIILKIEAGDDPVKYNGKYHQREGTSTKPVPADHERQLWKYFLT